MGVVAGLSASLGNQGMILQVLGDRNGVMVCLKEQERICREFGNVEGLAYSLWGQMTIFEYQGRRTEASHTIEEALSLATKGDYTPLNAKIGRAHV